MRLSEFIYLVGAGIVGPAISHDGDSNVYVLRGPDGCVMIDCGGGEEPERIEQQMEWDGLAPDDITHILVTHAHWDHACGLAHWRARTGAKVIVPEGHKRFVEQGGMYYDIPQCQPLQACPVDGVARVGESLSLVGLTFDVIDGSGHTDGAVFYRVDIDGHAVLIPGDAFYFDGRITVFCWPDADLPRFKRNLEALREVNFDSVLPGHRFPWLKHGKTHLEHAIRTAEDQLEQQ